MISRIAISAAQLTSATAFLHLSDKMGWAAVCHRSNLKNTVEVIILAARTYDIAFL